ncbi:branched-chain amino acid ABC transporter permease [Mesorhizobium sp. KR1-2]|uniref:branched-chain amino acid ABC transporter permease n=1 Tax=Mesorhizobium sp. KR1-2 TaxID=3156609 RepID=UPI0032B410C8
MTGMQRTFKGAALTALLPIAIALLVIALGDGAQVRILSVFLINLILVIGLQMFMGNTSIVNLGHVSFMGIAGYAAAILTIPASIKQTIIPEAPFGLAAFQMGPIEAGIMAIILAMLVALIVGVVVTRESGISATILTLALLVIVHTVLVNWVELTRGMRALYGVPMKANAWLLLGCAVLVIFLGRWFRDSPLGVQLRASGESRIAAESAGVNVRLVRLIAWVLSSGVVALGGVLYVYLIGSVSPKSFYFDTTLLTLAMLILGGMHSISGAVIGVIVVTAGFEIMRYFESSPVIFGVKFPEFLGLTGFFLGLIIVLSMALRPKGVVGTDEIDESWERRRQDQSERTSAAASRSHA